MGLLSAIQTYDIGQLDQIYMPTIHIVSIVHSAVLIIVCWKNPKKVHDI